MAKLFDKLMNRVIKGKLIVEQGDELGNLVKVETSSDISELSDEVLDSLKVGDVVQKVTGNMKHCYIVTYKEEHKGICLSYFDCGYLETISYDYTLGHWVFNSKDVCEVQEKITTNTDLYVKSLSIGSKNINELFVKIMDAPSSTTLTDEQKAIIKDGVFINGTFMGYKNPVFFPSNSTTYGCFIGCYPDESGTPFSISSYVINASNVISKQGAEIRFNSNGKLDLSTLYRVNGKEIPNYPSDTGTYVPKCVDGVLTWVADE